MHGLDDLLGGCLLYHFAYQPTEKTINTYHTSLTITNDFMLYTQSSAFGLSFTRAILYGRLVKEFRKWLSAQPSLSEFGPITSAESQEPLKHIRATKYETGLCPSRLVGTSEDQQCSLLMEIVSVSVGSWNSSPSPKELCAMSHSLSRPSFRAQFNS